MKQACLEWGAATAVLSGQPESGDRHLVCAVPDGMLVAAVDGLGHGSEAALASRIAVETVERYAHEPVISLLRRCHQCLLPTRGVVMSLAAFNAKDGMVTWIGVGNVEGLLLRADPNLPNEALLLRSGVVGAQLPSLQAAVLPVIPGDVLVFATDGVQGDFASTIALNGPLQMITERVLARHSKGTDDALVLMVRYRGGVL